MRAREEVDRHAPVPLYEQIKNLLVAELRHASDREQQRLLSDAALMRRFGVSRMTVRSAVADLVRQGVVMRVPGRGTFLVSRPPATVRLDGLERFVQEWSLEQQGQPARILGFDMVEPPAAIALRLRLPEGGQALLARRLREQDGEPVVLDEDYIAPWCAEGLSGEDLATNSIFNAVERLRGIRAVAVEQGIAAEKADQRLAAILRVSRGSALLARYVTFFTAKDEPMYTGVAYYRSDRFTFQMRVTR
ncbi:MAG: GntR family transcriptional regulator [bacterium]|nr:GntR family transcriptional regulator [bacterium]